MKQIKVKVQFAVLDGPKEVVWSLEEALASDLGHHVKNLMEDRAAVGMQIQHPFYGRVNLELEGKF